MQMTLFETDAEEKLRQVFVEDLKMGSSFENGKKRIYYLFNQNLTKGETIKQLKDEYGIGGKSTFASGGYRQHHDSKGIEITLETRERKLYTWSEVYDALFRLIESGEYIETLESDSDA